jgi:hypothetical protein
LDTHCGSRTADSPKVESTMNAPKTFISYCWTSTQHEQWVIDLATQLRESGVDVILDKWDLREGQDSIAFMEKMVTDPSVRKVVMVFDRGYADKADKRSGGVGTETQIISSEVYDKVEQTKFVGVASELDADGKPFRPAYYKARIYIDLSSEDIYPANFEQLLRWIFDKPLHVKPTLGKQPEFLKEQAVILGTGTRARRAKELIQNAAPSAEAALEDYLFTFAEELEKFRISRNKQEEFDDQVIETIGREVPYRNEYIEVLTSAARFWNVGFIGKIQRFFEKVAAYQFRRPMATAFYESDFDVFRFISNELFLHTVAILLRSERMAETGNLLTERYYLGEAAPDRREPMHDFTIFNDHLESLERRNQRLSLRRLSLHADLLEQRSHGSSVSFQDLMQADFILFLRNLLTGTRGLRRWWPFTLVFAERMRSHPFEIFARAQSAKYLERVLLVLGINSKNAFDVLMTEFNEGKREAPRWQFDSAHPPTLSNWINLGTLP